MHCLRVPGAALSDALALPVLSKAGAAGLVAGETPEPPQSRAGSDPCSSGMGRDAHEEKRDQEPQLENPSHLSMGPFLGSRSSQAKANKENRSINSSCLP